MVLHTEGAASSAGRALRSQCRGRGFDPPAVHQPRLQQRAPASRVLVIHWIYGAGMIKKLTKHGNSLALVIDRPILDLLKIDPDTLLDISTDGKRLLIEPAQSSAR